MRKFFVTLSVLFLLVSLVLVYTMRAYTLNSLLVLGAWVFFLLVGAFLRSRLLVLISAGCWLMILLGFIMSLLTTGIDPTLPTVPYYALAVFYAVFLLPLAGLPFVHYVCIPISAIMLALSVTAFWLLYRSTTKNREKYYY